MVWWIREAKLSFQPASLLRTATLIAFGQAHNLRRIGDMHLTPPRVQIVLLAMGAIVDEDIRQSLHEFTTDTCHYQDRVVSELW